MTKPIIIGAAGAACVSMAFLGSGVSTAAPDVVGMKYSDAAAKLNEANLTPVVATVVGDRLPRSECFVTGTTDATFLNQGGKSKGDLIMVHLNCYPKTASASNPGYSAGNNAPDAEAVRSTVKKEFEEWLQSENGLKWCADTAEEHPDWGHIDGCP